MSGNRMTGLVAVVALLVLTSSVYGDYETAGSSNYFLLPTQKDNVNANFPTVSLTTVGITKEIFKKFIKNIQDLVVSDKVQNISRLRNASTVPISKRFILVKLENYEAKPITLAIDVTNLYVVGYSTGDKFYYFLDSAVNTSGIFNELPHTELPFNGSYPALRQEGGDRINIPLGIAELEQSIGHLRNYRRPNLARSFIIVIQMVSEAARFSYIESLVVTSIKGNGSFGTFNATATMISLENNWSVLSGKIQNSVGGEFPPPPVQLVDLFGKTVAVCLVDKVRKNIAVMLYVSNTTKTKQPCSTSYDSRQGRLLINSTEPLVTPIIGFKDLCMQPNYGNTVWIEECVSNKVAQEWAIYPDGSIRPNGNKDNCLTWESYPAQGKNVVVGPCDGGAGQRWQFNINGSISNLNTELVLDVDLNLRKIIVLPFSGTASQIWQAWHL